MNRALSVKLWKSQMIWCDLMWGRLTPGFIFQVVWGCKRFKAAISLEKGWRTLPPSRNAVLRNADFFHRAKQCNSCSGGRPTGQAMHGRGKGFISNLLSLGAASRSEPWLLPSSEVRIRGTSSSSGFTAMLPPTPSPVLEAPASLRPIPPPLNTPNFSPRLRQRSGPPRRLEAVRGEAAAHLRGPPALMEPGRRGGGLCKGRYGVARSIQVGPCSGDAVPLPSRGRGVPNSAGVCLWPRQPFRRRRRRRRREDPGREGRRRKKEIMRTRVAVRHRCE